MQPVTETSRVTHIFTVHVLLNNYNVLSQHSHASGTTKHVRSTESRGILNLIHTCSRAMCIHKKHMFTTKKCSMLARIKVSRHNTKCKNETVRSNVTHCSNRCCVSCLCSFCFYHQRFPIAYRLKWKVPSLSKI